MDLANPLPAIRTARDAANLFAPFLQDAREERLMVALLDSAGRVLGVEEESGGPDSVELPIRRIVRAALDADAAAILLAHNHPSGDPSPSARDKAMTRRLAETANAIGMKVRDHLIFGGGGCRSFRAMGLL
ncbi:JAB domain-containing protein [Allosphingosinicella vermicomposti]|uniref:JAB domain-containing protein n=1 Tax=Allosphingosinicella vermicomposti TaxID=614671 RepID=UPI00131A4B9F|nr:JAB domain-containing protein [Allosphingosinicella vermicomposti]